MRIGIISDIHGNFEALQAVLEAFQSIEIDKFVCLGDVVGYGAQPNECCEAVREIVSHAVLGNHDAAVSGRMDYSYYYAAARHALDWTSNQLSKENLEWLNGLLLKVDDPEVEGIRYTHGNPLEPGSFGYVFAVEQAKELLSFTDRLGAVNFIGHSHLCRSFALGDGEVVDVPASCFGLQWAYKYIISVGSVGQPRDYDNRACAGVYDSSSGAFEYFRVEYDIDAAAKKIFEAGLAANFGKRLYLGI